MSMSVGSSDDGEDAVMSTINTTPLVDVMLVMLIIFLITIPVVTTSIPVALPKERIELRETKPENVIISVDRTGNIFYYETKVQTVDGLVERLKKINKMEPQPEVQVRGDLNAQYEGVGRILLACQRAGIVKVSFITEPPALGG
jgi:biopolymer transport protein ExbD